MWTPFPIIYHFVGAAILFGIVFMQNRAIKAAAASPA
jgi:hypothetical protein